MNRWRILLLTAAAGAALGNSGCIARNAIDKNERLEILLNEAEKNAQGKSQYRGGFWMNDQPSHMTDERVLSGITPDS